MTVTINGTTGIAGVDGSAATPAVQGADTNTGVFYGTDIVAISTGGTEAMRINASGNVGVGTSSIEDLGATSRLLKVAATASSGYGSLFLSSGSKTVEILCNSDSNIMSIGSRSNDYFGFLTNDTERMRISPDGLTFINQTAQKGNTQQRVGIQFAANVEWGLNITNSTTTTGNAINFTNSSGTQIGQIQNSTSATSYVTSSDYRLKENVAPITTGLTTISALKPVSYDWIGDKSHGEGFIAHELQELVPLAVTGQKDAVDSNGNPVHQGVDHSKIVVHLVAAIQEQQAMIIALTARITALEATP